LTGEAHVATPEAARLASAMARHFGHKAPVERDGERVSIRLRMGDLELVATEDVLRMRAEAARPEDLARVEEVATDHLRRFARLPELPVDWTVGGD
jgi:uncharacterized protein